MMADALSENFCSLCGFSFYRFGSESLNTKTSLASPIVEESGLLNKLNIALSPVKKELVFICYACRNVFINYNTAKANFEYREQQALNLLIGPVDSNDRGQLPFVPYLKRKCLLGTNSDIQQDRPPKIQKLDDEGVNSQVKNESSDIKEMQEVKVQVKEELPQVPSDTTNVKPEDQPVKATKTKRIRQESMKYVERGRYRKAVEKLWRNSKRFRQCCRTLMALVVKKETRNLVNHCTVFTKKLGLNDIGEISWGPTMLVTSRVAPTTLCLLFALLGLRAESRQEARSAKHNIVGCILSQALYKRFKRQASFIPLLHSLYLHQTGTSPEVRRTLHPLGLTVPSFRLSAVLKEREACQEEPVLTWKKELEIGLERATNKPDVPVKKHTPDCKPVTSYGLCWGRIQPSRHLQDSSTHSPPSISKDNLSHSLAQAYASLSRVPFSVMPEHSDIRQADNIPFEEFIPDSEDFLLVREQMEREVQKILVKYVALFSDLPVAEGHQHSHAMSQKSRVVEVGPPFLHPTNHGSAATTLKRLGGYMGQLQGEPVPLVVFGGPGAVERAVGAKDVMSCFSDKADRLDGLEPATTDHSRDVLLAKHIMQVFFPNEVLKQQWVMQQLRVNPSLLGRCLGRRDVSAMCSFLNVVAHSYTLALGEERLAGVRIGKIGLCAEDKSRIMEKIATDIVADIWPRIDTASLDVVRQGTESFKDRDCSYEDCVNYKEGCETACSERCGRPFFLCCRAHLGDGLVECARRENCCRGAWFHINRRCSGLLKAPKDDWLCRWCSPRRRVGGVEIEEDGGAWEYHRGLLWYCLLLLVGSTAEAQGNGWLQHALWKVCMPLFHTYGHTHYLQQGYSFLSGVAGRVPRLAAHDMVHNRTLNLRGGPNSNISWDHAVRLLSRESRRGAWSEGVGSSSTKVMQSWTYSLRMAWERDICQVAEPLRMSHLKMVPDVASQLYLSNALRTLPPLPGCSTHAPHVVTVKNPDKLVEKLKELCHQDAKRQINEREREMLE